MTGSRQVSGQSDLPWEEAVRLDLRYLENLVIIARTVPVVARSAGVR